MISNRNVANAVGGKTARACDSCIKRRARWYCAADDAFLCQACDSSVHSANPLARRHERVRLKTSSFKSTTTTQTVSENKNSTSVPSWHKRLTRKARTPRHGKLKTGKSIRNTVLLLVPEIGSDEISHEENEEDQLLYRVPIFDPFTVELCKSANSIEAGSLVDRVSRNESKAMVTTRYKGDMDNSLQGFLPSDMELAEFAADVESLLGSGLENESFAMEELGLGDYKERDFKECAPSLGSNEKVKVEVEEAEEEGIEAAVRDDDEIDSESEPFEINFYYVSPATCGDEDEKVVERELVMEISGEGCEDECEKKKKMKKLLCLDYEAVITAWASQGSPWTTGDRPEFDPDEYWPDCMGTSETEVHSSYSYTEFAGIGSYPAVVDCGREARVSRYREKRRTRLFSKKIRYEVRKLNADKRPRMKGRFVKIAGTPAFPLFNK